MTLALAILGTILGVASLTLSLYNLVVLKAQSAPSQPQIYYPPYQSKVEALNLMRGAPEGPPAVLDNFGMPETYDAAEDFPLYDEDI